MPDNKKFSGTIKKFFTSIGKLLTFNITTIMFGALLLYMIITVVLYATSDHVTSYQVTVGPLSKNPVCTALALRSEQIVTAENSGYIEYYATEGMEVRQAGSVYSIASEQQEGEAVTLSDEQIEEVRSSAEQFSYAYNSNNFYDTYSYKYLVRGTILQAAKESMSSSQTAGNSSETDEENTASVSEENSGAGSAADAEDQVISVGGQDVYTAPEAGIVVYSLDGYEEKTADTLTEDDFNQMSYQKENLITGGQIEEGDSVYKLITSENWTLMVPLTDKMAASIAGRESIQVKFVKDGESQNGALSIINIGDQKVAQIELVNGMTRYAQDRFLEVELVINTQSGLKIPVSSIVEKEFYTVPREFMTLGDNGSSQGFIRETSAGDASSTEFVEAAIYRQVDSQGNEITEETQNDSGGLCYVDMDTLNEGDVLLKPDSGETFTVGEKDNLQGVYNINQGYAVFRQIEILDQNEEYCIVDQGTSYGLRAFDYIARDGYRAIEEKVEKACLRAGRKREDVTLIAVSKTKPVSMIHELLPLGVRDFGENKVQELTEKEELLPKDIRWHMIGHLQRNKVKYVVGKACMIHSVDSLRLAEEISKEALKKQISVPILVEVNVAGEESKFGVSVQEAPFLVEQICRLPGIEVKGLMTIAPYVEDPEENRIVFRNLRKLSVDIGGKNFDNVTMDILSMGMTGDYEVAIEEGATHVRVGTGIFGERNYNI